MKKLLFLLSFLVASTSYAQEVIGDSLFIRDVAPGKVSSVLKSAGNGMRLYRDRTLCKDGIFREIVAGI